MFVRKIISMMNFTPTGLKEIKTWSSSIFEFSRQVTDWNSKTFCYADFDSLKLKEWNFVKLGATGQSAVFRLKKSPDLLPRYDVIIDCSMSFSVYDWPLPDEHQICNIKIRAREHFVQDESEIFSTWKLFHII